jgi:two-component system CheB/CheR fusion protein
VRLLLVEDSNDILFLIQKELEWAGYLVSTASDGKRAIEVAKKTHPDLIISDIKMPEIDGYQFIQQVKKIPELESVPAIAMTGFGMARDVEMAMSVGYSAHLVKPIDISQLCRLIEELTAGGTTFSNSKSAY